MKILLATSNAHKIDEIKCIFQHEHAKAQAVEGYDAAAMGRIEWVSLSDVRPMPEPVEDQDTFVGNAALKARHYAQQTGLNSLADDSGLEVDALKGEPGVRSARFAGVEGPRDVVDPANNALLLRQLGDLPAEQRSARFVCAMILCGFGPADGHGIRADEQRERGEADGQDDNSAPNGRSGPVRDWATVRGTVEGRILGPGDSGYAVDNPCGRGANGFGYDPLFLVPRLGKTTAELSSVGKNGISHRGAAACKMWRAIAAITGSMTG